MFAREHVQDSRQVWGPGGSNKPTFILRDSVARDVGFQVEFTTDEAGLGHCQLSFAKTAGTSDRFQRIYSAP
jgi:hypothetical protein